MQNETEFEPEKPKSPVERLEEWFQQLGRRLRPPQAIGREAKAKSGGRTLVILAGSVVCCLLLFAAMFTTSTSERGDRERRTAPRLGRPTENEDSQAAGRSIVPHLSAEQQAGGETGELSEGDVLSTMRNRGTAPPKPAADPEHALGNVEFSDPALEEAYRQRGQAPPPQREYVAPAVRPAPIVEPARPVDTEEALQRSSLVYVRTASKEAAGVSLSLSPAIQRQVTGLLPQGTRLVARLQHAVSSTAEMPVTAVIEYNYEHEGRLVVPAGSKAIGGLTGATPRGWAEIKFHTLELPNGRIEEIAGSALALDLGPLRGDVNGKNTGKKFLVRTLQGIGSAASYLVGEGGLGRSQIDGAILLRERMADNVARAGEEELRRLAYQQQIVVTVPANTRFYLVLHDRAFSPEGSGPGNASPDRSAAAELSEQELEELVRLRNELRLMNGMMSR
ncbi:MAG: TrbI/VirB10 family protein [Bryobacteraceae bacterium]|nr:TrbI/VirB10 family protein [Bryobacteraceae bacterium]